MTLNVGLVDTAQLAGCSPMFGLPKGLFAVSTARVPASNPTLTFATADFFDFRGTDRVNYGVRFSPDGDAVLDFPDPTKWLPADSGDINSLRGDELALNVKKGRGKKGPCNGKITQNWRIKVTKK